MQKTGKKKMAGSQTLKPRPHYIAAVSFSRIYNCKHNQQVYFARFLQAR